MKNTVFRGILPRGRAVLTYGWITLAHTFISAIVIDARGIRFIFTFNDLNLELVKV